MASEIPTQGGKAYKRMHLKDVTLRGVVDLTKYEEEIVRAHLEVVPEAYVRVYPSYYVVETPDPVTDGQARMIGRLIAKGSLAQYVREYFYGVQAEQRSGQLFVRIAE